MNNLPNDIVDLTLDFFISKPLKIKDCFLSNKVNWYILSMNPAAIHLLEENLDEISWGSLSENPAAIHLLEKNLDKVDWWTLSKKSRGNSYFRRKFR